METVLHGLAVAETPALRQTFVHCVKTLQLDAGADVLRPVLTRALSEGWGRPEDLVRTVLDVVRRGPALEAAIVRAAASPDPASAEAVDDGVMAELAKDELLLLVLTVTPNIDFGVERVLASARRVLLKIAQGGSALSVDAAALCAALAHQCFINEYVFGLAPGEAERAAKLGQSLSVALASRQAVPAAWVLAAACYAPLSSIPLADRLCDMVWPEAMAGLLNAQIAEPATESILRRDIPRLTPVGAPSLAVQAQYEENPYPRWIRTTVTGTPETLSEHLRNAFPHAELAPFNDAGPEVLIAGCGTGRNALETHRALAGARTLAIDLSLTSLAYAWRKAREAGETDLQFAQADLLNIAALGRSFDLIEASGVLHHLAEPFAGWRALLSVLRPGGVMRLGFYSALARRGLPDIEIAEPTLDALRQARQTLATRRDPAANQALLAQDFYSLSGCRDLLFHTREHRFALGELAAFMRETGLRFIGFVVDDQVLAAYRRRFPHDPGGADLRTWAAFEQDHPDTFAKMYQFWVQKR
jgi:SAM-dependent methyltransferase